MNSNNNKSGSVNVRQPSTTRPGNTLQRKSPVAQPNNGVSAQSVKRPVAPPVYKPEPPQRFVQRKLAVAPVIPALAARSAIQLSQGAAGGKAGEGYSTPDKSVTDDMRDKAYEKAKLPKKIKGHKLGNQNSNWSDQTKHESARYFDAIREVKAEKRADTKKCRSYHKRVNRGTVCPTCGEEVID